MLNQHCYSQAAEGLQLSLVWMKQCLLSDKSVPDTSGSDLLLTQTPLPAKRATMILEVLTALADGSLVEDNLPPHVSSVLEHVLEEAPSSNFAFPVCLAVGGENCMLRHAALVSHNLGIACFCLNNSLPRSNKQLLRAAGKYAEEASTILLQQLSNMRPEVVVAASPGEWHCLAIAAQNSLIQVLRRESRMEQAHECYDILVKLRASALEQQQEARSLVAVTNSAAAAA